MPCRTSRRASGSCNNWVTSVTSPIDYSQFSGRADWTLTNTSRIMVRYTQDSWKNDAPSIQSNLWGDDPFPAVDSNWDQPSRSFVASLNQTIGNSATNTLQFSYSANKIEITRGGLDVGLSDEITSRLVPILGYNNKEYGADTGHPVFWGGSGYGALWNEAPFLNNQDLFVIKDDYTKVFGKHFVKAGVLGSFNKKNEDTIGNGSSEHSNFWGAGGLPGWGSNTGNVLADFLLRDMTWGFSEFSAGRNVPQRWRDLEMYAADSWQISRRLTFDYGVRYSLFYNSYADDDKICELRAGALQPGPRRRRVQRLADSSRHELVPAGGCARGHGWTEPLADGPGQEQLRAAPRHRLGRPRQRQDGGARRLGPVLPARTSQSGPADRRQPAVHENH